MAGGERHREEYEREFMAFLDKLVNDLERKLRKGKDRLDVKPSDPTAALNPANDEFEEKRTILDLQIKELIAKIEQCGEEGRVQEAQELMMEVEKYRAELERLRQLEAESPSYRLEKRMEVCQTCGAFLIIGDALKRIEAHFEGRQHNGWARIREALADLRRKYSAAAAPKDRRAPSPEPGEIGDEAADRYVPRSHGRDQYPHYGRNDYRDGSGGRRRDYERTHDPHRDRRDRHDRSRDRRSSRDSYEDNHSRYGGRRY